MVFLVDQFLPVDYEDSLFHMDIYWKLLRMSRDVAVPHLIFHGPPGSGKKTLVNVFLRMLYGDSVDNTYTTCYDVPSSGKKVKREIFQSSAHHIAINPTGTNFDRHLVHEVIKRYATANTIDFVRNPNEKFRVIQISNVDHLSHSAQTSLRRMIEVNADKCRFIMICHNLNNVIYPLVSRCICIRVPRPGKSKLFSYVAYKASEMKIRPPFAIVDKIVKFSECNIRVALWYLEMYILGHDIDKKNSYHIMIDSIVDITSKSDIDDIENIRNIIFNIMMTNYEPTTILRDIVNGFLVMDNVSDICKINIALHAASVEHDIIRGRRDIIHFDAFIINVMRFLKNDHAQVEKNQDTNV